MMDVIGRVAFIRWLVLFLLFALGVLIPTFLPTAAHAQAGCTITGRGPNLAQMLDEQCVNSLPPEQQYSRWVFSIWRLSIGIVNIGVVIFIIVIALATILHWNIDTYGLKKALPTLIVAVILANFSLLIARAMVDLANILILTFVGSDRQALIRGLYQALGLVVGTGATAGTGIIGFIIVTALLGAVIAPPMLLFALLAAILLVLTPALLLLVLYFLLYIRIAIVLFLASIAPLAFVAMALPGTQTWFKRWWGTMLIWIFMAPAVFLLLRIGSEVGNIAGSPSSIASLVPYLIALGAIILAIQVPFKMGGAIMAAWGGVGKLLASPVTIPAKRVAGAFGEKIKAGMEKRYQGTWMGRLETEMKTHTEIIKKETEARKALTERLLRERRPDFTAREDRAEFEKRELERVKEQILTNIEFNNPGYARTKRATEQAITLAKMAREKYGTDIDMEKYVRRLPEIDAQINALAPGDPMRRRLEYERSRMMRLVDEEQKTTARGIVEDATPELQLGRFQYLLDNPGTTEELGFGAAQVKISGDDLRNFSQRNFAALDPNPEIASLKAQAIVQQFSLTMREWLRKGPNDPQFYDGVERATEIARRLFPRVPSGARAGQQWLLTTVTPAQLAAMSSNERRQFYVEASRELQQIEFAPPPGVSGPSGTLGMGRRPSSYHP